MPPPASHGCWEDPKRWPRGFVSSNCWWDRRRDLARVLAEAFLPPRIEQGDLTLTDHGADVQTPPPPPPSSPPILPPLCFSLFPVLPRVIPHQRLGAPGRDGKVPSEGPRPPSLPDRCFGGSDGTRRGWFSRLNSHLPFPWQRERAQVTASAPKPPSLRFRPPENQALLTPSRRRRWRGPPLPPTRRPGAPSPALHTT